MSKCVHVCMPGGCFFFKLRLSTLSRIVFFAVVMDQLLLDEEGFFSAVLETCSYLHVQKL